MTEEITEAIRNAFNEYLNAVDKIILENQALQIELQRLEQENKELKEKIQILNKNSYTRLREMTVLDAELDEVGFMNNKYRSALDTIQRMVLSAWELGKYLDGGLYNDLTNEFAKINEVLK